MTIPFKVQSSKLKVQSFLLCLLCFLLFNSFCSADQFVSALPPATNYAGSDTLILNTNVANAAQQKTTTITVSNIFGLASGINANFSNVQSSSLTVSNPAPAANGGNVATMVISGNQAQGGFADTFQSTPANISLSPGGNRGFLVIGDLTASNIVSKPNSQFSGNAAGLTNLPAASISGTNWIGTINGIGTNPVFWARDTAVKIKASDGTDRVVVTTAGAVAFPQGMQSAQLIATNGSGSATVTADGASGSVTAASFSGSGNAITNVPPTSTNYHRYDLVRDFGATNDGFCFNNITISGGTANLTATAFSGAESGHTSFTAGGDSIVGKVICVYGVGGVVVGGISTNCFTTTVQSVTDGTHLVLAAAVPNTVSGQVFGGVIGSDNTLAIQAALNTVSNGMSEVVIPPGIYVINGAPTWTNRSQLRIPPIIGTGRVGSINNTLKLTAQVPGFIAQASVGGQAGFNSQGVLFWSTRTNLDYGSVLDAQNYTNSVFTSLNGIGSTNNTFANTVNVVIDGVNWRSCWGNNGKLLALHGAGTARLSNLRIDTGYTLYSVPQPGKLASSVYRSEGSWGLTVPSPSSSGPSILDSVEICGFYHGVNVGEHVYSRNVQIESCMIGLDASTYPGGGGHRGQWIIDFEACKTNIFNEGGFACAIQVNCTSESPFASDWSFPSVLVSDAGGVVGGLLGTVRYENTSSTALSVVGAAGLDIVQDATQTAGQTTNKYANVNTLWSSNVTFGAAGIVTPLTILSSGVSIQFFNPFQNLELFYNNNNGDYWSMGSIGSIVGHAAALDFVLNTFADGLASAPTYIFHHDGQFEIASNNLVRGGVYVNGASYFTNLTASRIVLTDANKGLVSAAASGAVPIDADGSASTAAQINALNIGSIITNLVNSQSANYNVLNSDSVILLNGNLTATLPTAVGIPGKQFTIMCKTSGTNGILSTGGQTFTGPLNVVGAAKWTNSAAGRSTTVISDNANWWVLKTDN